MSIGGVSGAHQPLGPGGLPPDVTFNEVKQQILALGGSGSNITQDKIDAISGMIHQLQQSGGATPVQISCLTNATRSLISLFTIRLQIQDLQADITYCQNALKHASGPQAMTLANQLYQDESALEDTENTAVQLQVSIQNTLSNA